MLTKYQIDNYEGAGLILHTWDWKFLMVQDVRTGKWGMCKGHREEADRHYLDTAKYEAYEELNLTEDDYEITTTPFVLKGSPKIYIFQFATLLKKFEDIEFDTEEISAIKLVPYEELMKDGANSENNIYVRLFISHITGKFVPVEKKTSVNYTPYVNRFSLSQPMCAPKPMRVTPPMTPERSPLLIPVVEPSIENDFRLDDTSSYQFKPLSIDTAIINNTSYRPPASSLGELDELETELAAISASSIMDPVTGRVTPRLSPSKSPRIMFPVRHGGCGESPHPSSSPTVMSHV